MIKLFKDFTSMKMQQPMNESVDCVIECNNTNVEELCSKIKEMAVNINYDIMQVLSKIKPEESYHGIVHRTTCDILSCKNCQENDSDFNAMTELSTTGSCLITDLSGIPAKLMSLIDTLTSYQKATNSLGYDSIDSMILLLN